MSQIGIVNWCPSTHGSGFSPTLASLLYQIDTRSTFNHGVFVFNPFSHHVDSFLTSFLGFPRLFYRILLDQCLTIIGCNDAPSPDPTILNLNYKLFQGSCVLDIVHNIQSPKAANILLSRLSKFLKVACTFQWNWVIESFNCSLLNLMP